MRTFFVDVFDSPQECISSRLPFVKSEERFGFTHQSGFGFEKRTLPGEVSGRPIYCVAEQYCSFVVQIVARNEHVIILLAGDTIEDMSFGETTHGTRPALSPQGPAGSFRDRETLQRVDSNDLQMQLVGFRKILCNPLGF